jgi:peptidoglycan/xylan/chitin deacetylase (PgdA/CDA1 family)
MGARRVPLGTSGPVVSFTFDDFPRTALTVGGHILKAYGARGTYYAAPGLMNTSSHLGDQFRRGDLESLLSDGHELGSHTFSHVSCRKISSSDFRREVEKGRIAIEELTGQSSFGNFAFPFGEVTLSAKRAVGQDVASSRGIWNGCNGPEVDLNLLFANSLYGGREKCDQIREAILENERRKSWLIFYSHDVQAEPSQFGCTSELLEFAVSFAAQRSGRIAKVAEVVAELVANPVQSRDGLEDSSRPVS